MAKVKVHTTAKVNSMEALNALLSKMDEQGFLPAGESVDSVRESILSGDHSEQWFSDRVVDFKILSSFSGITLFNFRFLAHKKLDDLFAALEG